MKNLYNNRRGMNSSSLSSTSGYYGNYGRGYNYNYSRNYGYSGYKSKYYNVNWGWEENDDEINDDLYFKEPDFYKIPTSKEIKKSALGLLYLGVDGKSREVIKFIKELSIYYFSKMVGSKPDINPSCSINDEEKDFKKEFFDKIELDNMPGFTPLEKAVWTVYKYLNTESGKNDSSLRDLERKDCLTIKSEDIQDPFFTENLESLQKNNDYINKLSILNKISLVEDLGKEFEVKIEVDEKRVDSSYLKKKQLMNSYNDIPHVELYEQLMPDYKYKLLTKNLICNIPVARTENKQKIIMLVDYSGSMYRKEKQEWVTAILLNRLRYVIKGEAEVYFAFYVWNEYEFYHLKDKKTVLDFLNNVFNTNPNGGETNIGRVVTRIADKVSSGDFYGLGDLSKSKPEILVIHDGQDSVKTDKFPYKVNSICLIDSNEELKKLSLKTGGRYVHIDRRGNIKTFAK